MKLKKVAYLLFILFGFFVLFSMTEIYLRWLMHGLWDRQVKTDSITRNNLLIHRKSSNLNLVYELTPNAKIIRDRISYHINSEGFRDGEFSEYPIKNSLENPFRIVVLGDSVAWGWGVNMEDAWPQKLENSLNHKCLNSFEIYNLSVNGYSTQQEVEMLNYVGLSYKPNLIILNYTLNDPTIEEGGMWPYFQPINRIELFYRARIFLAGLKKYIEHLINSEVPLLPHNNPWDYSLMIHDALFDINITPALKRLSTISKKNNVPVIIVITPLFEFKKNKRYPWAYIHQQLKLQFEKYGFTVLDTQKALNLYNGRQVSVDLIHPNSLGHMIISNTIKEFFLSNFPCLNS